MVELEAMTAAIHPTTSSIPSFTNIENGSVESVSNNQLASLIKKQMADDSFVLVILDCRPDNDATPLINGAQLIRMPSMLLRRLKTGKLTPTSISPLLTDPHKVGQVVLVPDNLHDSESVAILIAQTLLQHQFQLGLFQENPKTFAEQNPDLVQNEEHENEMSVSNGLNFRLFNDGFKYDFNKTRRTAHFPAKVIDHVYLGNVDTAKNRDLLKEHGINYIINVTNDLPNYFEDDPEFQYLRIPVDDNYANNLARFFPDAISFIEKARNENSSILVHCLAGISRSVTVCLAYLMFARQYTLDEAFDQLHRQNHSISPNFNFMKSLLNWERQILKHHQRASSHPQQTRIKHEYEDDSGHSSLPSSSASNDMFDSFIVSD